VRTTVTLDADVEAKLRQAARERGQSFKAVLNDAVRAGLSGGERSRRRYRLPARPLGVRQGVDLDSALRIGGELEDVEILRKLRLRK
jgi:plasmid stability protein